MDKKTAEFVHMLQKDKLIVQLISEEIGLPIPQPEDILSNNKAEVMNAIGDVFCYLLLKLSLKSEKERRKIKRLWDKHEITYKRLLIEIEAENN